jgi:hypothetical protein
LTKKRPEPVGLALFSTTVDHPVQSLVVIALVVAGRAVIAAGEPAANTAPKRERLVSPHVAQMLADAAAQQPSAVSTGAPVESAARQRGPGQERDVPANGIVRLPPYLVREPKLPSREELMTRHEIEQLAMDKYFGEETSLYRVMNMFSPVYLWRKIPGLGKFPFMIGRFSGPGSGPASGEYTTEDRARVRYEKERRDERMSDLMGLLSAEDRARVANPEAATARPRPAPLK